jgi:hypothetical protein
MVSALWQTLRSHFSTVMPYHFHGIIILQDGVGGDGGWDDGMGA